MQAKDKVDTRFALYTLGSDEIETTERIIQKAEGSEQTGHTCKLLLMPTHHIDAQSRLNGFRLTIPASCNVGDIPFPQDMFFGMSACECIVDNKGLARLIACPQECMVQLQTIIDEMYEKCDRNNCAGLHCIPQDVQGVHRDSVSSTTIRSNARRAVDNQPWEVESPSLLGVYQAHIRNPTGERRHAVFVVCEGGCSRASNEYHNLMLDLGDQATISEAIQCEETWWLQKACSRARNHILYVACQKLGLQPKASVVDMHSNDSRRIVTPFCETLRHDISRVSETTVQILNHAVDTTKIQNGIMCKMHPSEGIWLFRGAPRATAGNSFGGMFGDHSVCGAFPTHTFETLEKDRPTINHGTGRDKKQFLHFNNKFMQNLQEMGWDRDYGIIEMIPIAVVHGEKLTC